MFYVCSFDLYHLSKTKSPCNLKKKKLFIDNVSFVHNHMFGIRQTPKTRGHIMDSSTGSLTFNLELWLFTKYVHKQILPFVTHGLMSMFPVYSLLMNILMLHL